jgi:hypothetical protein
MPSRRATLACAVAAATLLLLRPARAQTNKTIRTVSGPI